MIPGWDAHWSEAFAPYAAEGLSPGRVAVEHRSEYRVVTTAGELAAEIAGRLRHEARTRADLPAVGDFVALRLPDGDGPAIIHAVLRRKTALVRKAAGERAEEQVVAANVDVVFLMAGLDHDFNLRRLERYLTLAWEGGASPVILLNKADLCEDLDARVAEVSAIAIGVPIHVMSALATDCLEVVAPYLDPGCTASVLGSSGVGKSTLINQLLGREVQRTQTVREDDDRGRHTTTSRQMFLLPSGATIIDTPGMRELQLWDADEGLDATFRDVELLAADCRFADCRHDDEPGCAVRAAMEQGALAPERLASFAKLQRELRYVESLRDEAAARSRKRHEKSISKAIKRLFKDRE